MIVSPKMREREEKIGEFQVLNMVLPDHELLTDLGVYNDVKKYFVDNGFGFVFDENPPFVFERLVREFVYSF